MTDRLSDGLMRLAKQRGVQVVQGRATFEDSQTLRLQGADLACVRFGHAIIATGSTETALPGVLFQPGWARDELGRGRWIWRMFLIGCL